MLFFFFRCVPGDELEVESIIFVIRNDGHSINESYVHLHLHDSNLFHGQGQSRDHIHKAECPCATAVEISLQVAIYPSLAAPRIWKIRQSTGEGILILSADILERVKATRCESLYGLVKVR